MNNPSIPIRIPLVEISGNALQQGPKQDIPQGLRRIADVEVSAIPGLPDICYALELPEKAGELTETGKSLGIFGIGGNKSAERDIYVLGLTGQQPIICKVIKNDSLPGSTIPGDASAAGSASSPKPRRKSFMTPTPLHIPESRVSPIPDSAHEMIYLHDLNRNEALRLISLKEVVWMHPLISVVGKPLE